MNSRHSDLDAWVCQHLIDWRRSDRATPPAVPYRVMAPHKIDGGSLDANHRGRDGHLSCHQPAIEGKEEETPCNWYFSCLLSLLTRAILSIQLGALQCVSYDSLDSELIGLSFRFLRLHTSFLPASLAVHIQGYHVQTTYLIAANPSYRYSGLKYPPGHNLNRLPCSCPCSVPFPCEYCAAYTLLCQSPGISSTLIDFGLFESSISRHG